MTKITIKIILSLFIATLTITFIGGVSSCLPPAPPNIVCIEVDQDLCPNADFSNTVLDISNYFKYDYSIDQQGGPYGDGYPTPEILALISTNNKKYIAEHLTSAATDKEVNYWKNRYVEGYEINYGFWSEDSYRKYSYAEIFEWKYGRKPTETEEQAITDQQAKDWFIERHTVHRPWLLGGDDPPRDVKVINPPIKKYCFNLSQSTNLSIGKTATSEWGMEGSITFANGVKCMLTSKEISAKDYDANNSPHTVKMRIAKVCSACN